MRKEVYVAVWGNRHHDTGVFVFSTASEAIRWASEKAREANLFNPLDENLTPGMARAGWIYYGCYSDEGDHIRVVECLVDEQAESTSAGESND